VSSASTDGGHVLDVDWTRQANSDLRGLSRRDADRIKVAVRRLATAHYGDTERLKGIDPPRYRLRVGDWMAGHPLTVTTLTVKRCHGGGTPPPTRGPGVPRSVVDAHQPPDQQPATVAPFCVRSDTAPPAAAGQEWERPQAAIGWPPERMRSRWPCSSSLRSQRAALRSTNSLA